MPVAKVLAGPSPQPSSHFCAHPPTHRPSTGMLLPVPKFSKFLHGTALLLQPHCRNVPYWFLPGGWGGWL